MNDPLRLVIFDVDGTLIDSQAHILAAMARAFSAVGRKMPDRQVVLGGVGLSLAVLINRICGDATPAIQDQIVEAYKQAFADLRREGENLLSPLYPGARAALELLSKRDDILMGIATGKSRRGLAHMIETHGLGGMFQTLQTADDHPSKPNPAMVLACLVETGVDAGNAAILGDTSFDMEMGQSAGIHTIGVSWGYHASDALFRAGAGAVLQDFGDFAAQLAQIWGSK